MPVPVPYNPVKNPQNHTESASKPSRFIVQCDLLHEIELEVFSMSRLFAVVTILVLISVLAIPAFARENAPSITDGTSNTVFGDGNVRIFYILPYIEQDN
jgi:hypothetical protein